VCVSAGQGYGVQVSPLQAGTPALKAALLEVLSNPKYAAAARAMAVKIKAHPRTPVQEAAGGDIS
jgi:UDP:flavonoid glycosyltransferase YjiC (YdhE family)